MIDVNDLTKISTDCSLTEFVGTTAVSYTHLSHVSSPFFFLRLFLFFCLFYLKKTDFSIKKPDFRTVKNR